MATSHLRAETLFWQGRYPEAEAAARTALDEATPGTTTWYRSLGQLSESLSLHGHYHELDQWVALLDAYGRERESDVLAYRIASLLLDGGRIARADELIARSASLVSAVAGLDPRVTARLEHVRGRRALQEDDLAAAVAHFYAAASAFAEAGDPRSARDRRVNAAACRGELGDPAGAASELRTIIDQAGAAEQHHIAARARQHLGPLLLRAGDRAGARQVEQQAADFFALGGHLRLDGISHVHLSSFALLDGDLPGAERLAREAVAILRPFPPSRAIAYAALGRALLARGRTESAIAVADVGLAPLRALASPAPRHLVSIVRLHADARAT